MEIIKELERQGYQVILELPNIRCRKIDGANPDPEKVHQLFEELRRRKSEVVEYLKNLSKETSPGFAIWCEYKGRPRWIHPAVCQWHRQECEPECAGCDPEKRPREERTYH